MADVDINFLVRQNERMLAEMSTFRSEMANFRDDVSVLTAMLTRVEGSLGLIHTEMQALHRKFNRFSDRLQKLEDAQT